MILSSDRNNKANSATADDATRDLALLFNS